MSRIAPTSSVAGKPRRITANWSFEHNHSGPPPIIAQSNVGPYYLQLDSRMTDVHDRKQEVPSEDSSNECTNDGTDSGLGSATMLSGDQEILEYMAENLMQYMNPRLLLPQLVKCGLVTGEDAAYISSPQRSEEEQKEHILCALVVHEADSTIERLVNCLAGDSVHSNHCFMARKLRDAIDAKKQHPELPLSSLRLGTPPHNAKESSPPAAPIKPRGAAQRNSIAKLLATKKNNVASLISQIETRQSTQEQQLQQDSTSPSGPTEPRKVQKSGKKSIYKSTEAPQLENKTVYYGQHKELSVSSATRSYHQPSSASYTNPQSICLSKPHSVSHPVSPTYIHPLPTLPIYPHPDPTSPSHLYPISPPHSHLQSPSSPPHKPMLPPGSHSQPISLHQTYSPHSNTPSTYYVQSPQHFQIPTPSLSHSPTTSDSPSHSQSPHSVSTPPLPHTPPSLSGDSQEDSHGSGSLSDSQRGFERRRPVNEVVVRQTSISHGDSSSPITSSRNNETVKEKGRNSKRTSGSQSQRKSLSDRISTPKSPQSLKTPMIPSARPKPSNPIPYTDITAEEMPSPAQYLPSTIGNEDLLEEETEPIQYSNHATRKAGLTARFYKHRRSASMSSYDTRSFKRGDQLYASEGRGKEHGSAFHQHSRGNAQLKNVRASVREGTEKLVKRRIDWLQERVQFTDCPEHIQFTSQTHYGEERELIYSGTLNKHGKPRFVVLFTDYLLVLKARRPSMPSKLGGMFSFQQPSRIDWFSDLEYTARKPLPLHLLTVQHQSSKQSSDTFCLHFNDKNKVIEVVLQAVSKEARDIWVEELSESITLATSAHASTFVLVGNRASTKISGEPYKKLQLQIFSASSLGLAANCNSFSLFCVIELGRQRCRTPSVMGGYNPSWGYKCEFTDFSNDDSLLIEVFSENIFRPNDFLGCVNVMLTTLPEEQSGRKVFDGNMVLAGLEEAFAGELHIAIEQGWETKM